MRVRILKDEQVDLFPKEREISCLPSSNDPRVIVIENRKPFLNILALNSIAHITHKLSIGEGYEEVNKEIDELGEFNPVFLGGNIQRWTYQENRKGRLIKVCDGLLRDESGRYLAISAHKPEMTVERFFRTQRLIQDRFNKLSKALRNPLGYNLIIPPLSHISDRKGRFGLARIEKRLPRAISIVEPPLTKNEISDYAKKCGLCLPEWYQRQIS